jgi:hypothetical protein
MANIRYIIVFLAKNSDKKYGCGTIMSWKSKTLIQTF